MNALSRSIENAADEIWNDFAADSFHRNGRQRARDHGIADERISLVAYDDLSGLGDRLKAGSQISLGADDRIIHSIIAAEVSDIAKTRIYSHSHPERVFDPTVAPLRIQAGNPMLHLDRHAQAGPGVFRVALGFRIAEKHKHRVADELVNGATVSERNVRHLREILIEQFRDLLRLEPLCRRREVFNIGKENRQLLPLSVDRDVLLSAKDALIVLRRQIPRYLH